MPKGPEEESPISAALQRVIAERERAEQALLRRLNMERLVSETSRRFINVAADQFDAEVDRTLRRIGELAHADRAYLFQLRDDGKLKDNTHEWCAADVAPEIERLQGLPVDDFPWWMEPLKRIEEVHIPHVAELPDDAQFERDHLLEQEIQSLVLVPMAWEGSLVGFLGFDAVRTAKEWQREDTTLLRMIADVLVVAIQRQRTEEALRAAEVRVRQLEKMEAVGQLAGGVAHDFNNLLAVIGANAHLVVGELDEEHPALPDVLEIIKATNRAAELVRQLLAFARRQLLQPRVLSLNSIVEGVTQMLRRVIGENIDLAVSLDPALNPVRADPGQMEQVVLNLAVNARDAMAQGGRISITTANVDAAGIPALQSVEPGSGSWVSLSVSDTGTGMDEPTRLHIFEPFYTTKEVGHGTGLGLATVYGIVSQSRGEILVESEVGVGTTFTMILPAVAASAEEPQAKLAPVLDHQPHETVLLVEDEPLLRKTVRRMLARHGYSVLEAGDGEEALEIAEQHRAPIHLVLSDVVLPKMSGPACCERLQASRPKLAVVYMSGYADDALFRQGVQDSTVALLRKPFSEEMLMRAVRSALEPDSDEEV